MLTQLGIEDSSGEASRLALIKSWRRSKIIFWRDFQNLGFLGCVINWRHLFTRL